MQPATFEIDQKLTIKDIIQGLLEAGRLDKKLADDFLIPVRSGRLEIHPLVIISQQEWVDQKNPKKKLTLESLTQWLAHRSNLPYLRIDPLKVDVTAVTAVMSSAYATRHKILPIKVDEHTLTVVYIRRHQLELGRFGEIQQALQEQLDSFNFIYCLSYYVPVFLRHICITGQDFH